MFEKLEAGAARLAMRVGLIAYLWLSRIAGKIVAPRPAAPANRPLSILLTGTFHSDNWARSHILPLARSPRCGTLTVVTTFELAPLPGVTIVRPSDWQIRVAGAVVARMVRFGVEALRARPDVVGGFHLLFNGLWAGLLARFVGARSLYFCVVGPVEVIDGGVHTENRLVERIGTADRTIERRLLDAVRNFDFIVTMGTRARSYFESHGVFGECRVIPGAVDAASFAVLPGARDYDLVLVARLVAIKRIDRFLQVVDGVRRRRPGVRAVVVGDGPLRASLERLVADLDLARHVTFAGRQSDVGWWLARARVFVLTSESEGLSLSLMEAMTSGLPAVVPAVGDLPDLVEDGRNGYLVAGEGFADYVSPILRLLECEGEWRTFSEAARHASLRFQLERTSACWSELLA
ncbi:MAG: glycosyltransferase [Acidobacteria bacterium]|nr:glycosyltransferase [Acidobacteriota bacterium]